MAIGILTNGLATQYPGVGGDVLIALGSTMMVASGTLLAYPLGVRASRGQLLRVRRQTAAAVLSFAVLSVCVYRAYVHAQAPLARAEKPDRHVSFEQAQALTRLNAEITKDVQIAYTVREDYAEARKFAAEIISRFEPGRVNNPFESGQNRIEGYISQTEVFPEGVSVSVLSDTAITFDPAKRMLAEFQRLGISQASETVRFGPNHAPNRVLISVGLQP